MIVESNCRHSRLGSGSRSEGHGFAVNSSKTGGESSWKPLMMLWSDLFAWLGDCEERP